MPTKNAYETGNDDSLETVGTDGKKDQQMQRDMKNDNLRQKTRKTEYNTNATLINMTKTGRFYHINYINEYLRLILAKEEIETRKKKRKRSE